MGVIALGNAQSRPDREAAMTLRGSRLILVGLDADHAGSAEAWRWWLHQFHQAKRWPPLEGKDPGEMWAAGVDLLAWIEAGLAEYGMDPTTSLFSVAPLG